MRIALFVYSLGPGGAERQVSLLARELAKEHEVTLVLVHERVFYEVPKGVEIVVLDRSSLHLRPIRKLLKLLPLAKRYAKLLSGKKIEVSISFMNRPNYINILAKMLFGAEAKVIASERGSVVHHHVGLEGVVSKSLVRFLYPNADRVVTNSKGSARELEKVLGIEGVKTIYNMFDVDQILKLAREKPSREFKGFNFITVGRLDRGKNHRLLIRALKKSGVDANLLLIGEGPLEEELRKFAKELGLEDRVHFLGKMNNPFCYLARSDAFVFGSTNEGFPNVLVEALACSLPVISTDCPWGPREILGKEYGILVSNGDVEGMAEAMRRIYEDEGLRKSYSTIALKRAEDFSIERIMPSWRELIKEK
jgi:N-acetylgalactosamine-N,N'-diacetylbacillosaminyl-diphospho-undecaprenol 4-alpha-N-acetylgalactosaminyltransferase